eukprot:m51a1_g815 putative gastric triacylglycerol lipase isoform 1 (515) ;mRNA; f:687261-689514
MFEGLVRNLIELCAALFAGAVLLGVNAPLLLNLLRPAFALHCIRLAVDILVASKHRLEHGPSCPRSPFMRDYVPAGFTYEEHEVVCEDGHVLTVHRLYREEFLGTDSFTPVVLQHGVLQRGGVFLVGGRESIGVYLAERGCDVWISNARGVFPKHTSLSQDDPQFWNFCLDELAKYDFPALVKYVSDRTGRQIVYVGHSQGGATGIVGMSDQPMLASRVRLMILLAPAVLLRKQKHWVFSRILSRYTGLFELLAADRMFFPCMFWFTQYVPSPVLATVGTHFVDGVFGWKTGGWRDGWLPAVFHFTPAKTSSRLVLRWFRMLGKGGISRDHGDEPFLYSASGVPVAVFVGTKDVLVEGGPRLRAVLERAQCKIVHWSEIEAYDHMELLFAKDNTKHVCEPMLTLIRGGTPLQTSSSGGEKIAIVHDTHPPVPPPKERPAKSSYQEEFSQGKVNQFGKAVEPYHPEAQRSIKEPKTSKGQKATQTTVQLADPKKPFNPKEHYQTTYRTEIGSAKK